jgi:RNA polymerase sigma-70 factor, ECF subfamily
MSVDACAEKLRLLIPAAAGGDVAAFRSIYDMYLGQVTRTVGRYLGPGPEIEDVVQEVFVELHRSLGAVSDYASYGGWVYRVARNVAISHLRKTPRSVDFVTLQTLREPSNLWEKLAAREKLRMLYVALDCLSEDQREAVVMYEIEGMTLQEIADLSGASINTVASRVRRGREQLVKVIRQTFSTSDASTGELA